MNKFKIEDFDSPKPKNTRLFEERIKTNGNILKFINANLKKIKY
jgi:hypothetical protein